ncbi:MAG: DMT family transporter [Rhizobiales bacterium]|nr:DMT family transporter [Hyphomicrobiales bacterium]
MPQIFVKIMPLAFVFLWSTGFIAAKMGLPYIEAYTFLSIRLLCALAILWLILMFWKVKYIERKEYIFEAIIAGGLISGVYFLGVFSSIQYGLSAGLTALIVSMQPILTALIVRRLFHEKLEPKQWLGIMIAFLGVCMILAHKINADDIEHGLSFIGLAFATMGLLGITIGTIYQKNRKGDMDLRAVTFWQNVGALIVIVPWAIFYDTESITWSYELIFSLSWLVIILSIVTLFLLLMLIKQHSANQVASLFFLVPGVTAVFGWLFFEEVLGWFEIVAIIIASCGVLLARRIPKTKV